ncbi:MAG TPA: MtrB/PioB family outer membrane beta-barrel protein, partial [Candidatus Saccharimonadales bacterium]|nr:MtrB/PioB family outer membrane beta-barrel protein [Candidatus Saccharimonadales bacterium]
MTKTQRMRGVLVAGVLAVSLAGAASVRAEGDFLTFGSQWLNQTAPEAKYTEYRELPKGAFLKNFLLTRELGRNQFSIYGENALQTDQATRMRWHNGVRWNLELGYSEIPHNFSFIAKSPWTQVSPGVFRLPDSAQAAVQKKSSAYRNVMTDLLAGAPTQSVGIETDISTARLKVRPIEGLLLDARATRRERTGEKAFGASMGFNDSYELTEPVDQRMADADVRADYCYRRLNVQASVGMSEFDNHVQRILFDNPRRLNDGETEGPAESQLSLYPDNQALRGNLMVGVELPHQSVFTAAAGISRAEQDQQWLPYTINKNLVYIDSLTHPGLKDTFNVLKTFALPDSNTHAKAVTRTVDMRLTSRLLPEVSATLHFHSYRYDNQTPSVTFPGEMLFDMSWTAGDISPDRLGSGNRSAGLDVNLDPVRQVKLDLSYELRERDHPDRELFRDTENWFAAKARVKPLDRVNLTLKGRFEHARRHGALDTDALLEPPDSVEQPGLRRYDLADRTQNLFGGGATWTDGRWVDLSADLSYLRNDYPPSDTTQRLYGLMGDTLTTLTLGATVHATEQLDFHGGIGMGWHYYGQRSHLANHAAPIDTVPSTDWSVHARDKNYYWFASLDWRPLGEKLAVNASFEFS